MNKKLVLAIGFFLLEGISQSRGDGFIVVERPIYVPPTHFPFAPLEVTSHHVNVAIDGRSPSHRSTRSSTILTINDSKAFTCSLSRKGHTSTNSAWKSAARASMRSCSRLTRRV